MKESEPAVYGGWNLVSAGLWFFAAVAISFAIHWTSPTKITTDTIILGPPDDPDCSVSVHLDVWKQMNDMGLWKWPAACVAAKQMQEE